MSKTRLSETRKCRKLDVQNRANIEMEGCRGEADSEIFWLTRPAVSLLALLRFKLRHFLRQPTGMSSIPVIKAQDGQPDT